MRSTSRVWLVAASYGIWAGLCALASFAAISALSIAFTHSTRSMLGELIEFLPHAAFAAIVATLGWAILHLRSHQPGPGAYIALAVAIVIVVHLEIVSGVRMPPEALLVGAFIVFLVHFWITIPVAVGATGLFVWCLRRWSVL